MSCLFITSIHTSFLLLSYIDAANYNISSRMNRLVESAEEIFSLTVNRLVESELFKMVMNRLVEKEKPFELVLLLALLAFISFSLLLLAFICFSISIIFILLAISKHKELEPVVVDPVVEKDDDGWVKTELYFRHFTDIISKITEEVSPEFTLFGHNWRVVVVPGKKDEYKNHVALHLQNMSDKSINIRFILAVKHSKGKKRLGGKDFYKRRHTFSPFMRRGPGVFYPMCSLTKCYVDGLLTTCPLVDDTLRIEVKVKLVKPEREPLPSISTSEDCPICMEPITKPWGVVTPCGHPYHHSCWDEVVTRHWNELDDDSESEDEQPSCVVCRKEATGFQRVYLDLGCTEASASAAAASNLEDQGSSSSYVNRLLRRRTRRPLER